MIGFPAVSTLFVRPGRDLEEGDRARDPARPLVWAATLAGIGGGVCGTMASLRRAKIHRLYPEGETRE